MTDPYQLLITQTPIAYAVVSVTPDHDQKTVSLQIVRIGINTDVPNEGQEFYWLSIEKARILQRELARAIDVLEPPQPSDSNSAAPKQESATAAGARQPKTFADSATATRTPPKRSRNTA